MRYLPVLPVKGLVLFPNMSIPLRIKRPMSVAAVQNAYNADQTILVVAQRDDAEKLDQSNLFQTGVLAKIESLKGTPEEGFQILLRGLSRFQIEEYQTDQYIKAMGVEAPDRDDLDPQTKNALITTLKTMAQQTYGLIPVDTRQLSELVSGIDDLSTLVDVCATQLDSDVLQKQKLVEMIDLKNRSLELLTMMQKQKEQLEVQSDIRERLNTKLGQQQRENILREQLKTIREELGETQSKTDLRSSIEKAQMPLDVQKIALDELTRMESMGPSSPESHMIRTYIETLIAMPWAISSGSDFANLDIEHAKQILNKDHYGLDKIKKRVLQHLAVLKLRQSNRGQILLLVGPPGVGKTSLGKSIADAMNRKFVRGSLGGVRDESEIRGHRRTYIGALPGRILQGLKRVGQNDAVFMLDEIDKLGRGFQGDPASALLEVLDPEQNSNFLDHYLDVPFDLSNVFFIATANSLDTIPGPLLDRMEVIEVNGYTTAEKLHIAKNHLFKKQIKEHGMSESQLSISDEALLRVISSYTREAGVRDLNRQLATICRGMAEAVVTSQRPVHVEVQNLLELLGAERFAHEVAEQVSAPGVATGLAWTPMGGEILFIEANSMPGKGNLIITGQLGEVMRESTQIALSLVRSRLAHLIPNFEYSTKDIHVHVPAGAIPKDGPSAGVTMLTALASLLTDRGVKPKLAMTGELTLRGAVTPVGGIKEKVIAAHRAGVETIILAEKNRKDLLDIPEEIRSNLKFHFVSTASEVLKIALDLDCVSLKVAATPAVSTPAAAS